MAQSNGKMRAPGHRSVYLITFSQCDSSQLSQVEFANLIVEAWHSCSRSKIVQWVDEAQERLGRAQKTRIELLQESTSSPCVEYCHGQWMSAATEMLELNGIATERFSSAIYNALKRGRGKYRNVYLFGPANCGKTFLVSPLKQIFECFVNPASGSFAWIGIEDAEVVLLNDFRWKPSLIVAPSSTHQRRQN